MAIRLDRSAFFYIAQRPIYQAAILLLCLGISSISPARADNAPLIDKITALLDGYSHVPPQAKLVLHVTIRTPPEQLAKLCVDPELSLSGSLSRLTGPHSVVARCPTQRRYLQVDVDATATWWQAAHLLPVGQQIAGSDIRPQRGRLGHLPAGLILDPQRIIGRVPLRTVRSGENLVASQLRQRWAIKAGGKVEIILTGAGFSIKTTGKALDNAALNTPLRIQMPSGQILSATAIGDDKAAITAD